MAKRITDEQIEQINELYCELGVKSQVAKIVGVSVASVTKYLQPNYIPKAKRTTSSFTGFAAVLDVDSIRNLDGAAIASWLVGLTEEEKADLEELQKEILV